jgi:hypothetical protein
MRYTVVDGGGTVSFVGPCHALKMFAAACSRRPRNHRELLALAAEYDPSVSDRVLDGLAVFDEHNTPGNVAAIRARISASSGEDVPPFRVLDEVTRRNSLDPVRAGLVVFNLPAQRIVQVQNTYADLMRRGRGRIRRDGRPTGRMYHYELPPDWSIVP